MRLQIDDDDFGFDCRIDMNHGIYQFFFHGFHLIQVLTANNKADDLL